MNEEILDFVKSYIDSKLDDKISNDRYVFFEHRKSPKQYLDEILFFIIKLALIFLFVFGLIYGVSYKFGFFL